jgi:hypothetical protein
MIKVSIVNKLLASQFSGVFLPFQIKNPSNGAALPGSIPPDQDNSCQIKKLIGVNCGTHQREASVQPQPHMNISGSKFNGLFSTLTCRLNKIYQSVLPDFICCSHDFSGIYFETISSSCFFYSQIWSSQDSYQAIHILVECGNDMHVRTIDN